MKLEKKKKRIISKKEKIKNMIILVLLLVANSYAWFIYNTEVDTDISVHVSAWSVQFVIDGSPSVANMTIDISEIRPGMDEYTKIIKVYNAGDTEAELRYEVQSLRVMNTTYSVQGGLTCEAIENRMNNSYPFSIEIEILTTGFEPEENLIGEYIISVNWPFESGDDVADTSWGNNAYDFHNNNPTQSFISLNINLIAVQSRD